MSLVESEHLLDRALALLAESARGRGQVVHISGPGASGKTTLLRAFADRAPDDPLLLGATCSRAERTLRGGVLAQLAAGLPEGQSERPLRLDLDQPDDPSAQDSPQAIREACEQLLEIARRRPVAITVDDVEHADPLSLQALLYLLRRIDTARMIVVLTESDHSRRVNALFRAELTRMSRFTGMRLSPLSPRGVAQVITRELDPATAATASALTVHAVSGGNPLLVKALLQDHRAASLGGPEHTADDAVVIGEAFRRAVLACLHRWDPELLEVVRAVAVLGENATPELLCRFPELTTAATEAVTSLNSAGLLDDGRFRHPAVRAAVLGDIGADELTELHQRAAELLYVEGLPSGDIATHLVAAGAATAPWSVSVLRDAADSALVEQRLDHATDCLKLARTACPADDEPGQAALLAALAAVQWRTTPSVVARHLPALAEAAEQGHLDPRDTGALLRYQLWHGRRAEAETTLRRMEEAAARPGSPVLAEHRVLRDWVRWQHPTVAAAVRPATGDRRSALARDHQEDLLAAAEWVLRNRWMPDSAPELVVHALMTLAACGALGRAKHWHDALREELGTGQNTTWKATLADARAHIALLEGDLAGAERQARLALATLSPRNWGQAIASPLAALVLATSTAGKHDEAEAQLKRSVPVTVRDTWHWAVYLRARGHAHLAAGRPHAALADFEECGELVVHWDLDLPALLPWRSDVVLAQFALGRGERSAELVLAQLDRPTADLPRVRGASLRALSRSAELKQRLPMLRESVALLQGCGDQVELSLALAALGSTHHALGEFGAAEVVAKRAVRTAEACGAGALCRAALPAGLVLDGTPTTTPETETTTETAPTTEPDDLATLSTAERRVAALAAMGHTNREIGRKLYITISTVEQHLTRVYRKLKVRRRADLPTGLPLEALSAWGAETAVGAVRPGATHRA
ncbi:MULTISPECIES: LuxR family transcriptional regulator [Actinosynnema]|uniref:helix-turn-helix transcriptional regulator n=1 Tax=Actinosynnema TaxID=40566 RepID=UPI0020A3983F|nr:AAA family ATPase [Actinosynnema pretiosum]MCP2092269.1 regulatory protein, luxR family [Actinosynnema pretiosum]